MKKYKLKGKALKQSDLRKVSNCPIYPCYSKINTKKDLLVLTTAGQVVFIGLVFIIKMINHCISIVSE